MRLTQTRRGVGPVTAPSCLQGHPGSTALPAAGSLPALGAPAGPPQPLPPGETSKEGTDGQACLCNRCSSPPAPLRSLHPASAAAPAGLGGPPGSTTHALIPSGSEPLVTGQRLERPHCPLSVAVRRGHTVPRAQNPARPLVLLSASSPPPPTDRPVSHDRPATPPVHCPLGSHRLGQRQLWLSSAGPFS